MGVRMGGERGLSLLDQRHRLVTLLLESREMGAVGGVVGTRQAGVAAVAGLRRRQEAVASRQDPVGSSVQLGFLVEISGVEVLSVAASAA